MKGEAELSEQFLQSHPEEAARILEGFGTEEIAKLLEEISGTGVGTAVIQQMSPSVSAEVLGRMALEAAAEIVSGLSLQIAAGLLRRMDSTSKDRLMAALPAETGRPLGLLLAYPENTAGALMEPRILVLPPDILVRGAIDTVRRLPKHAIHYLYVVNGDHKLVGVVTLKELMNTDQDVPLETVMERTVERLSVHADRAAIVSHPGWKKFHKLPVTEEEDVFAGVIGYKTLRGLERRARPPDWSQQAVGMALIFGELYWKGLAVSLDALSVFLAMPGSREETRKQKKEEPDAQPS